jgi:hypothetical protein
MANPWPPPPDPASIKELVANADVEGFIADGAPADEYDIEAEEFCTALDGYATAEITVARLLPVLEEIWAGAFELTDAQVASRRDKLTALATEVARFFGPEAQPQVRTN